MLFSDKIETPLGTMILVSNENGLCFAEFIDDESTEKRIQLFAKKTDMEFSVSINHITEMAKVQLSNYFKKELTNFNVPLSPHGTEFQKKVWQSLSNIPFGKTKTYKIQADQFNSPEAIRAIASANGKNPIAIIIPCHRVIGSDGNLTGYAGGLWRKKWLLEHEGALNTGQVSLF
ncbi:MAG: methylated-DNA--[protein]-cysteine S-methyltransferase [Bacteroidetes bacterium]|nr:methylated-DNA--[protein]-cysteine S-methyltransferase [Bacteroidota bacterium]